MTDKKEFFTPSVVDADIRKHVDNALKRYARAKLVGHSPPQDRPSVLGISSK